MINAKKKKFISQDKVEKLTKTVISVASFWKISSEIGSWELMKPLVVFSYLILKQICFFVLLLYSHARRSWKRGLAEAFNGNKQQMEAFSKMPWNQRTRNRRNWSAKYRISREGLSDAVGVAAKEWFLSYLSGFIRSFVQWFCRLQIVSGGRLLLYRRLIIKQALWSR